MLRKHPRVTPYPRRARGSRPLRVQRLVHDREIYLPGELRVSRRAGTLAPPTRTHHIWCSRHNPGALEVVNELTSAGGYEGRLLVTEERGAIAEADHVLLYLSLATWADDGQRKTELTAEIKDAMQAGRKLQAGGLRVQSSKAARG